MFPCFEANIEQQSCKPYPLKQNCYILNVDNAIKDIKCMFEENWIKEKEGNGQNEYTKDVDIATKKSKDFKNISKEMIEIISISVSRLSKIELKNPRIGGCRVVLNGLLPHFQSCIDIVKKLRKA
ncbi:hypothetical protein BpHYR1_020453 [Brachionus plicatilis]|uniref:Uncharacterized protein n=1 Tax=Brachionus plicatilis TaxID=10195 RepID=A0A3M7PYE6_BRAPC|nr:hypothetical protein BpHYR1_020453 [Brachionus plicatilis]